MCDDLARGVPGAWSYFSSPLQWETPFKCCQCCLASVHLCYIKPKIYINKPCLVLRLCNTGTCVCLIHSLCYLCHICTFAYTAVYAS